VSYCNPGPEQRRRRLDRGEGGIYLTPVNHGVRANWHLHTGSLCWRRFRGTVASTDDFVRL